jgi:hypothetical protein
LKKTPRNVYNSILIWTYHSFYYEFLLFVLSCFNLLLVFIM